VKPLLPSGLLLFFALLLALTPISGAEQSILFGENVTLRGTLANARFQFESSKTGRVAFLGGSITEMDGYRPMVCDLLKKRFPETNFTFTNAGIASTCSTTGAFRLATDVLAHGPVDLLFVEFAVNDDQDGHFPRQECLRGMEGIVRHLLVANPKTDIVMIDFVNEGMLQTLQAGKVPLTIEAHGAVAEHYGVSTINLAREAAQEITTGTLTWKQYGGVHPAPNGNAIAARMIDELFHRAWNNSTPDHSTPITDPLPPPLDALSYFNGCFIDPKEAHLKQGWTLGFPDWDHIPGSKRPRFTGIPMLSATEPGAEASLEFSGTAVGAYVVAGPDAGILEAAVDCAAPRIADLHHPFSAGLHYPRTVMFATDLPAGKHTLTLRISEQTQSAGHAARIIQFVANGD
jgi:lysophospholipase L1-like esterase